LPPTTTLAHSVGFPSPCATLYYSQSILPIHPIVSDFHHGLLGGATRVFEGRGDALLGQEAARMITRFLVFCECPVYEFRHALDPVCGELLISAESAIRHTHGRG
jgi:hypothetical protein